MIQIHVTYDVNYLFLIQLEASLTEIQRKTANKDEVEQGDTKSEGNDSKVVCAVNVLPTISEICEKKVDIYH